MTQKQSRLPLLTAPRVRVSELPPGRARDVRYVADAAALEAGRAQLRILGLSKMRLEGRLTPVGRTDWRFTGRVGATVTQACVATLEPVRTRIEAPVSRLFTADWVEPEPDSETEMPEEVDVDPLGEAIDFLQLALEEVALAMPDYPRAPDLPPVEAEARPAGAAPLAEDEAERPFAALKALRDRMEE